MTATNVRNQRVKSCLGLGLIGNLSLTLGLLPWFTLSAQGQAILLETNPAPATPEFDIPTEIAPAEPAPVYDAPVEPEVAYEPEPYYEPEPVYEAPVYEEPAYQPAPPPVYEPEPAPVYEAPAYEPEPYVEAPALPVEPAPAVVAQPPSPQPIEGSQSSPAQGCAALLDVNASGACAPEIVPSAPVLPNPAPAIVAEDIPVSPARQTPANQPAAIPPARRLTVASPAPAAIPPARQTTAVVPRSQVYQPVAVAQPVISQPVVPNYVASAAPVPLPAAPSETASQLYAANGLPAISHENERFTVVKPNRYGLKPLQSKSALERILGDQSMMFPMPLPMAVSSAFGWRQHPIQKSWHLHSGIDFAAPTGTPVLAAYDGQVAIASHVGGYGLTVLLSHQEGQRQTRYAHLSQIYVQPGKKVSRGDVIGAVGSTGNSTGPHLHFELLEKTAEGMVVVDPTTEVKAALISTLERMQQLAKLSQDNAVEASEETDAINLTPIPVEVIEPMSRYQANGNLSTPFLTE